MLSVSCTVAAAAGEGEVEILGLEAMSVGEARQERLNVGERYVDRLAAVLTDQVVVRSLVDEVVDAGPMAEVDVAQIAEPLQHVERPVDG